MWTETKLRDELDGPRGALVAMRAVCAIFRAQTADEQAHATTRYRNGVGFSQADAKAGTDLVRWMDCGRGDGILRRRCGGVYYRANGDCIARVVLCKALAWKYRKQLLAHLGRADRLKEVA